MEELDIYVERKLLAEVAKLAIKHYGDDSEASQRRVIETALEMHIVWSNSIVKGRETTEEAVSKWEFPQSPITGENGDNINKWLFRR